MKKSILISLLFLLPFAIQAQHETEKFQLKIGGGISTFKTVTDSKITMAGLSLELTDTTSEHSKTIPISFLVGVRDWWSFGLYGRIGSLYSDSAASSSRKNPMYSFGFGTDLYFINTPVFNMYINGGAHFTILTVYQTTALISNEYKYVGWGPTGSLGFNFFPVPVLGLNFNIGYEGQNLNLNEWYINDTPQVMSNIEIKTRAKGLHIGAGLNLMF
jgi:hypothetical protein